MNMIQRINSVIQGQKNAITASDNIFIIDYKNINGGEVEVLAIKPEHDCVHLHNENNTEIFYAAFEENALKVKAAHGQVKQCECVLFPSSLNANDWVLFVETKYTGSLKTALDEEVDYPNTMINQIISTVKYFRDNNILPINKRVFAIVSFPTLLENFSEAFFTRSKMTVEQILHTYGVLIRPTNEGKIISQKRLKL